MKPLLGFLRSFEGSQNTQIILLQNCQYSSKVAMKTAFFHPNLLFLHLSPSFPIYSKKEGMLSTVSMQD